MALDHSIPPASPGLTSQVATLTGLLGAFVADLEPDTLLGSDAAALYAGVAKLERLVVAAKCLLAPRIATSGHWEQTGHTSPAGLLATLEGVPVGQARRTLVTGQHLVDLPATEEALRAGVLSGPKAALVTDAAVLDPTTEGQLLAGVADEGLAATKERCGRARATSQRHDPLAAARRIHAERHFSHWTDTEGAFCFSGRDSAERGAALLARLVPAANRLRDARRAAAPTSTPATDRPATDSPVTGSTPHESDAALRVDALFALVAGGGRPSGSGSPSTDSLHHDGLQDSHDHHDGLQDADDLARRTPPATVIVRVDRDALVRGHALPGERCELDGQGPIPVPLARALAVDSFLALVFTEAGDIRAVSHRGRTINATLRTALTFRDRCCVVPGCSMPYGLEIDHVAPLEFGGITSLDNLALLCRHHHRLKTYDGWELARNGPSDEDPQWSFTPQPPFGQEPDLGLDRPTDRPPNRPSPPNHADHDHGHDRTLFDRSPEVVPRR
jgi:hypothetical protein